MYSCLLLPQYLDCLWHQILNLKRNNWEEHELIRPYIAFDGTLCDALQHTIPTIMLPSHNDDSVYPLPSVVYHMFDYADVPDVSFLTREQRFFSGNLVTSVVVGEGISFCGRLILSCFASLEIELKELWIRMRIFFFASVVFYLKMCIVVFSQRMFKHLESRVGRNEDQGAMTLDRPLTF